MSSLKLAIHIAFFDTMHSIEECMVDYGLDFSLTQAIRQLQASDRANAARMYVHVARCYEKFCTHNKIKGRIHPARIQSRIAWIEPGSGPTGCSGDHLCSAR
jgi:hypothetical protein